MVVWDEKNTQDSSINQQSNDTMSVMFCMGATFVKKNSCLVARIVSFDVAGLHLPTFHILESYPSKDIDLISVTLSHLNDVIIVPSN